MHSFGARKPQVDLRDYKIKAGAGNFPTSYELPYIPPVKNQLFVGQCTAFATSSILEYFDKMETGSYKRLSNNFIYGMQGVEFGDYDKGMALRDACKIVQKYGDVLYTTCSGNTEMPKCAEIVKNILNDDVLEEAKYYVVKAYAKCTDENSIKQALIDEHPILASMKWYKKYKLNDNNVIEMDKTSDYGYHAVMIYGYNEHGWLCQNSWGMLWGDKGRFVYPYTEKLTEAWTFVDADMEEIKKPVNNAVLNLIYKVLNKVINFVKDKILR